MKWLLGTLFLDSRFQNHPDSVILQKYQSLSNQIFKYNKAHMPSLYLTPTLFETVYNHPWLAWDFTYLNFASWNVGTVYLIVFISWFVYVCCEDDQFKTWTDRCNRKVLKNEICSVSCEWTILFIMYLGCNIYENTLEIQFCEKPSMYYAIFIGCFLACKIFWVQYPQQSHSKP